MRQGKYHMVIFYRQQLADAGLFPFLLFYLSTVRAMSVPATMVLVLYMPTPIFRTPIHVIAERCCAAASYSLQHFGYMRIFMNLHGMLLQHLLHRCPRCCIR